MAGENDFRGAGWGHGPNLLSQLFYGLGAPPDQQSFDVSPRRRLFASSGSTSVPLSSSATATATITLPDNLVLTDGLFFELLSARVSAADTTGHLTIVDAALAIIDNPASAFILPVATPQPTTLIPRLQTSLLFGAVPPLTAPDLEQWLKAVNPALSLFAGAEQPLKLQLTVSCANNDGAAAHSFTVFFNAAYRKVSGLGGA